MFKTLSPILAACAAVIALSVPFHASAAGADCEAKAVDKNGKALHGAAKTSFVKKCEADMKGGDAKADAKPAAAMAAPAASGAKK